MGLDCCEGSIDGRDDLAGRREGFEKAACLAGQDESRSVACYSSLDFYTQDTQPDPVLLAPIWHRSANR
jgi:hypothetical protein